MGGSSKNEDSASDSDSFNGDLHESSSRLFLEGEKVLAYHGPCIYEAKVQKAELRENVWRYFVHYLGWNKSWDEWVGKNRLMKHTERNVLKQQALDKKQGVDKNLKSARGAHIKPKISTDAKVDKEDSRNIGAKGKKRKSEIEVEKEEDAQEEKLIKFQIPSILKKQLVDDWESITQQDKLVKLPRSPNVDTIISKYMEYKLPKDGMSMEQVQEVMNGLRCYFNKALPVILLHKKEQQQYSEAIADDVLPSAKYGAEHLLRLFVKLPEVLAYIKIEDDTLLCLQHKLNDFLKFMQRNQSTFFLQCYDGPEISDGNGNGKDNCRENIPAPPVM